MRVGWLINALHVCLAGRDRSMLRAAPGEMQKAWIQDSRVAGPSHLRQPAIWHASKDLQPNSTWCP